MKLFSKLLSSRHSSGSIAARSSQFVESLEDRQLLSTAPTVISVIADNRGETQISLSEPIVPTDVTKQSVLVFTPGPDGIINTADDTHVGAPVRWEPSGNRVIIKGRTQADQTFRVRLVASKLKTPDGTPIDGDFTGSLPSGDGTPGGNFACKVTPDTSNRPLSRWYTSEGLMNVQLFKDLTPKNVANFLSYADTAKYDGIFFTRAESGFVIQGGGLNISSKNTVGEVAANSPVQGEPGVSNTRGRLSLALTGSPDSGTNEFFFNLGNNSFLDDTSTGSGPFTAFGQVRLSDTRSVATMDAIGNKPTVDFSTLTPPLSFPGTLTTKVPVNNQAQAQAGLDPNRDLVYVRRIAVLMNVSPLTAASSDLAPSSLVGRTINANVAGGTSPFASSGSFKFWTNTSSAKLTYSIDGTGAVADSTGHYSYTQTGTNTGTVSLVDSVLGNVTGTFTFNTASAGTYTFNAGAGSQTGSFVLS